MRRTVSIVLAATLLCAFACASKKKELADVAKDWCLTIRASQVLPVYPLTEDIQPGDLFLVQSPIDKQHEEYDDKGFLPFDNHLARLNPVGYRDFYANSFGVGTEDKELPKYFLMPGADKAQAWKDAPQAGFPSYSVSVRRGGGFSAALPISGIPIGLSLLGSEAADVTVTIDKARTYGVDTVSLNTMVVAWAERGDNRAFLANYAPSGDAKNYLRVVSRVYLTGRLVATLSAASSSAAGGSVGTPKPVDLLTVNPGTPEKPGTAETYAESLGKLNAALTDALKKASIDGAEVLLPGATVKVVAASSRSITVAEDFIDRPLVIGYLGFDYAIGEKGSLGPPIPTYAVVNDETLPSTKPFFTAEQESIVELRKQIEALPEADRRFEAAAQLIGGDFLKAFEAQRKEEPPRAGKAAFNSVLLDFLSSEPSTGEKHRAVILALSQVKQAAFAPQGGE